MSDEREEIKAALHQLMEQLEDKMDPQLLKNGTAGEIAEVLNAVLDSGLPEQDLSEDEQVLFHLTRDVSKLLQKADAALMDRLRAQKVTSSQGREKFQEHMAAALMRVNEILVTRMMAAGGMKFDDTLSHRLAKAAARVICEGLDNESRGTACKRT